MALRAQSPHLPSLVTSLIGRLLVRSGLDDLSFRSVQLRPARAAAAPDQSLAESLRPFRRILWRQRAGCVLGRLALLGLTIILLLNLTAIELGVDLSLVVRCMPLILCLAAGIWLAIAQRPTQVEVAQLLDRRHRLRELLSTAVELSGGVPTPLQQRQIALARSHLARLTATPWPVSGRGGWRILLPLSIAAAALLLLTPAPGQHAALRSPAPRTAAGGVHSPALVAQTVPLPHGIALPALHGNQQPASSLAQTHHAPGLAISLQLRVGPQDAAPGAGAAPGYLSGALGGAGTGGGQRAAGAGPRGSVQSRGGQQTGSTGGGTGGQGNGSAGQGQGGQQGNGQGGGAPQSGPHANPSQSGGTQGGTGNSQDPTSGLAPAGQGGQQRPPASSQGSPAASAANPFGQDQASGGQRHSAGQSGQAGGSRTVQGEGKGGQAGSRSGAQSGHSPSGAGQNSNGADDPLQRRHGTGAAQPDIHAPAHIGRAGRAGGQQINLGGHFVLGYGAGSPQLVRVAPLGAAPNVGIDGSTTIGTPDVRGYVPEDATNLGPDDQALVRTYFSDGSN